MCVFFLLFFFKDSAPNLNTQSSCLFASDGEFLESADSYPAAKESKRFLLFKDGWESPRDFLMCLLLLKVLTLNLSA